MKRRVKQLRGEEPWKKELHHQEYTLDKKLKEDALMEEKKEGFPIKDQKEVKREKRQFSINERKRTENL